MTVNNINGNNLHNIKSLQNDVNSMVEKLRAIADQKVGPEKIEEANKPNEFMGILSNAINEVNEARQTSSDLKAAYLSGDETVSLGQVVLASQKSKIAFQGLLTVRNKVIEAYKEIMNMQV